MWTLESPEMYRGMGFLNEASQQAMLDLFTANAKRCSVTSETFLGQWPDVADATPIADVVTVHHVAFNVGDIVPFFAALNSHARKRVVIEVPVTVCVFVPLFQILFALAPATPALLKMICVSAPATGPAGPVAPVGPVGPTLPCAPVSPVVP